MAQKVLILGNSGSGKSTSIRNLNENETCIIQCVKKRLPFKDSGKKYNEKNKNIFQNNDLVKVLSFLDRVDKNEKIKTLVIDDFNYLMTYGYKARAKEVGYSKFETLAFLVVDIFDKIDSLRDDLIVYIMAHTQKDADGKLSTKTIGRFLDEKVVIEGLFETVILALGSENNYLFTVNGLDPAKSPIDMFEKNEIENDLVLVNEAIKKYY
jgi:GTPase SAR1 family protein